MIHLRAGSHTVIQRSTPRSNMAVNETKILFESFLQKRKDTLKVRWATYWFRLQNTTLFFYTKMNGNALNLRGNYYIYMVQSVREVHRANSQRFLFELSMNNGKKKLLAAETAELRERWVELLWQAMHLSRSRVPVSSSTRTQQEAHEEQQVKESDVMESPRPPPQPFSASADHTRHEVRNLHPATSLPEASIYRNTQPACDRHDNVAAVTEEALYDVLPIRNEGFEVRRETENPYDVPLSSRRPAADPGNIYDVPSNLLRRIPDDMLAQSSSGMKKPTGRYEARRHPPPRANESICVSFSTRQTLGSTVQMGLHHTEASAGKSAGDADFQERLLIPSRQLKGSL